VYFTSLTSSCIQSICSSWPRFFFFCFISLLSLIHFLHPLVLPFTPFPGVHLIPFQSFRMSLCPNYLSRVSHPFSFSVRLFFTYFRAPRVAPSRFVFSRSIRFFLPPFDFNFVHASSSSNFPKDCQELTRSLTLQIVRCNSQRRDVNVIFYCLFFLFSCRLYAC